jgi:hypothetical protein
MYTQTCLISFVLVDQHVIQYLIILLLVYEYHLQDVLHDQFPMPKIWIE